MKITLQQLKRIIKEEIGRAEDFASASPLKESSIVSDPFPVDDTINTLYEILASLDKKAFDDVRSGLEGLIRQLEPWGEHSRL